jgi:hypothetical protein
MKLLRKSISAIAILTLLLCPRMVGTAFALAGTTGSPCADAAAGMCMDGGHTSMPIDCMIPIGMASPGHTAETSVLPGMLLVAIVTLFLFAIALRSGRQLAAEGPGWITEQLRKRFLQTIVILS